MLVLTTQDTDNDDDESVTIDFGNLPTLVTSSGNTTLNIIDDDNPTVTVNYSSSTYSTTEGTSTYVYIDVNVDPLRSITIPLTRRNNRASNEDYSVNTSSVTLSSSQHSAYFIFTATDDSYNDDGESVNFGFGTLPAGVKKGRSTTVYITDNDYPTVTVGFGSATYTVEEGSSASLTLSLSQAPERSVTIQSDQVSLRRRLLLRLLIRLQLHNLCPP